MTDNEIIQAFAELAEFVRKCGNLKKEEDVFCAVLDLINRLQAEIERLRYNLKAVLDERADHSEAIEEVICLLKEKSEKKTSPLLGVVYYQITEAKLDNLKKEMVGNVE